MTGMVAAVQMVSGVEVRENLDAIARLTRTAKAEGGRVVFLPENFPCFGASAVRELGEAEADAGGPIRSALADIARDNDVWLVAGTIPTVSRPENGSVVVGPRVRAACFVIDDDGEEVARYDKVHMFDADVNDDVGRYRESDRFEPGTTLKVVSSPVGRIGLSVCYDLRFPELYRILVEQGAEILSVPSAFTEITGAAHFEVLLRARAIENCSYVVAACQGGSHDSGRRTHGDTQIVGPWGDIIARRAKGEGVVLAEIDLDRLRRQRLDLPTQSQRRIKTILD